MNELFYLFCFARASGVARAQESAPFDWPALRFHREGDLVAVLAVVPYDEFCGAQAAEHFGDPAWIASRVVLHSTVVERIMRHSPVFPARLGTLFSSVDGVAARMRSHAPAISRMLDQVDGKAEWAVKGWLDRHIAEPRQVTAFVDEHPEPIPLTAGARYLRKRRLEAQGGRLLDAWTERSARGIFEALSGRVAAFRRGPGTTSAVANAELVANWAFLVEVREAPAFAELVRDINREFADTGLQLDISGPWPPYSFCESLAEPSTSWPG
ncbi:GvpL/GvpF family gas vesicle protein [Paraburkholderia sp. A1RI_3L]|uniref:GvpL/GvpF family gas vesicle protein n=1 Tax=Paraburkholderia TaxID=1822464 RepID=UPI003B7B743A